MMRYLGNKEKYNNQIKGLESLKKLMRKLLDKDKRGQTNNLINLEQV